MFFNYYKVDVLFTSTNAWCNSVNWFCMGMRFSVQFCTVWRKCLCFSLLILVTCSRESRGSSTWVCPQLCLSSSALSVLFAGEACSTCCSGCTLLSLRTCLCVFSEAGGTEGRLPGPNLPPLYTYSSPTRCSQIPPSSCFWTAVVLWAELFTGSSAEPLLLCHPSVHFPRYLTLLFSSLSFNTFCMIRKHFNLISYPSFMLVFNISCILSKKITFFLVWTCS